MPSALASLLRFFALITCRSSLSARRSRLAIAGLPLVLGGCTANMYSELLGHGSAVKDSPEAMARDTREMLDRLEQSCFSDRPRWKRLGPDRASCEYYVTGHWGLMDANSRWFEALTRGVATFHATFAERYPGILLAQDANGGGTDMGWGHRRYWSWRYLMGDGSVVFAMDRVWDLTWNMMETAFASEDAKITMTVEISHPCLLENPRASALVACDGMRQALHATPQRDTLDSRLVQRHTDQIRRELASVDRSRQESAEARAMLNARLAQEQRDSQRATELGLQQGLNNVLAGATVRPAPSVPQPVAHAQTTQTAQPRQASPTARPAQPAPSVPATVPALPAQTQQTASLFITPARTNTSAGGGTASTSGTPGAGNTSRPATSPASQAATQKMATYREAVVYCWANQSNHPPARPDDERWICHGPVQKIQAAETLAKALEYAGCSGVQQTSRRWPLGQGTVYGCGFGRESFHEDIAARYSMSGGIVSQLQTYRCPVPHNGRCTTRQ